MPLMLATAAFVATLSQATPAAGAFPASVSITIGRGKTWDDEGSIGSGSAIGAGIEYRFRPHWSVRGDVERLTHRRETAGPVFSGRTIFATAGITYRFARDGVSPYVGGGFGGAFYDGEFVDRIQPAPAALPRSSASTAVYGRAGIDVPISARFMLSPDFRLVMCQSQDDFAPWSVMRLAIVGAVRF